MGREAQLVVHVGSWPMPIVAGCQTKPVFLPCFCVPVPVRTALVPPVRGGETVPA